MIYYDKCIELQKQALDEWLAKVSDPNDRTDNVRIALELLGSLLPAVREIEKAVGVHLDEAESIRTFMKQQAIYQEIYDVVIAWWRDGTRPRIPYRTWSSAQVGMLTKQLATICSKVEPSEPEAEVEP